MIVQTLYFFIQSISCKMLSLWLFPVSQQSNELKDALEAEMEKTKLMEDSMKKLDDEMKRGDELLAQMIPKQVPIAFKCKLLPQMALSVEAIVNMDRPCQLHLAIMAWHGLLPKGWASAD